MFDLIVQGEEGRPLRQTTAGSRIVSIVLHVILVTLILVVPLMRVTNVLPPPPAIMAFVTAAPAPPPPPPPPPPAAPAARKPVAAPATTAPTTPANPNAAPIAPPAEIAPEVARVADAGVVGGVEGGVEGGVLGGIVGGLPGTVAPPPPPPPPQKRGPVRVGGQITTPALVKRVEPEYPDIAAQAQLTGIVILEATVGTDGCVDTVKVLRSAHPFLDRASVDALKQWQYSPLVLNGVKTPFVLTVTFNFSVARK